MATVLVVDDEPDIRYLTQLNLELDGHRVMTAGNGAEALAAVEVELPDVVLLDVMMPEVDGWTVLSQLKAHLDDRIAGVKVVMMTALGADVDRVRGGIEGAVRYLVKPVLPDDLRLAVQEALAGDERQLRRAAQAGALSELAWMEKGTPAVAGAAAPSLSRLEHAPIRASSTPAPPTPRSVAALLTDRQRVLLVALAAAPSVSAAAAELGVSRSNVYASLRRIARNLGVASAPEVLRQVRAGLLLVD